jgi:protein-disulfide isomerase
MKTLKLLAGLAGMLLITGCNANKVKELTEQVAKLESRLAAIEKMIMPPSEQPSAQEKAYEIPLEDSQVLGKKDARVSVVVFSNFECPYCARADKSLRELVNSPELKDTVNVVFKHFPFERHQEARPAAKAAMAAAEQGKFWEMTDKIFVNQKELSQANYNKWAKEIGLDMAKFAKDLKDNDQKYNAAIDRDIKLGAETAKLEGTPWILVGGWLLQGDISAASIKKMIDEKKL